MRNTNRFPFYAGLGGILFFCVMETVCAAPGDAALGDGLFARISTSHGDMVLRMEYQKTPLTVCNFVALSEGKMNTARGKRYYDGLIFHRIIDGFMIQGGDPQGNGQGGPGYRFPDEIDSSLKHDSPGILSMANAGPGTNGSQFFITLAPTPHLDGRHTVFGRVVQGIDVLQAIGKVKTNAQDRPLEQVTIKSVTIIRNGQAANAFKADQAAFDALLAQASAAAEAGRQNQRNTDIGQINSKYPGATVTPSGIHYIIQKQGSGIKPAAGKTVRVNYKGSLLSGKVFDSSDIQGRPIEFPVGTGRVISGWDEMILDMKIGEKRLAIIPPELAYGDQAVGNGLIPANSFLVFEMELIGVR